ncbi:MAG TPA: hypothetical protein VGZ22_25090 [Isosphaeraceae bacterium]|jgi:hypothetical protein|nr:hypothetical protein [Isosphaeraceae bacterium]
MLGIYQDHGIRFEYPFEWELEVSDDGPRTTVTVQAPDGLMFTLVTIDDSRPAPADLADEALAVMREEYPDLDAAPAIESIAGHRAIGHDLEFFSLDVINSSTIRCFRSPSRTVLVFDQWSDLAGEDPEGTVRAVRNSLEELEA